MVASISDLFGANATQDINSVTISKTDLATVGLTASADNTAESLLVSLILMWNKFYAGGNLITPNNDFISTPSGDLIVYGNDSGDAYVFFWRHVYTERIERYQYVVNLYEQ